MSTGVASYIDAATKAARALRNLKRGRKSTLHGIHRERPDLPIRGVDHRGTCSLPKISPPPSTASSLPMWIRDFSSGPSTVRAFVFLHGASPNRCHPRKPHFGWDLICRTRNKIPKSGQPTRESLVHESDSTDLSSVILFNRPSAQGLLVDRSGCRSVAVAIFSHATTANNKESSHSGRTGDLTTVAREQ